MTAPDGPVTLHPIGRVVNSLVRRKDMPTFGVPSRIELLPEFASGLLHLGKHTHLWVLAWLDGAARGVLQVIPRGLKPPPGEDPDPRNLHGVFAVRSPARPNPIGLTAAAITAIGPHFVDVDRLDFLDGTPVVDLKPYFSTRDCLFAARSLQVGRNASMEAVRQSVLAQALAFCGASTPDLELAVDILTHFRSEVLEFHDPSEWSITVPATRHRICDTLMGVTRAMPGRGEIRFHPHDAVLFEHEGSRYEYQLLPEGGFRFWPH
ncbi:MAG: tRNA (N6-threonylcarbamoyladenosine(37)-N6)-methyltransferase TrmO [Bryobacterales bacterium]|nr:tRNA (N6-threonylcarbamoyladenosine(37)-N6)-methyltransferase TrmO [Bryobacterales bacterium]